MQRLVAAALTLTLCFPCVLKAQSLKPLPTEFVDCSSNERGLPVASKKQKTPEIKSSTGTIAYGEVSAETSDTGSSCQNRTTVYVAESGGSFRPILRQGVEQLPDSSEYDGNGVAYLSWSPAGTSLLAVIFQWTYGTDFGGNYKYFLVDKEHGSIKLIFPEPAIFKQFKQPCTAFIAFDGWIDNQQIALEVRSFVTTDEEGTPDPTPLCVKEATRFSFDVATNAVNPISETGNAGNSQR